MKKFTALALAVLFMMFVTSCGDDKKTEDTLPDEEVTDEDTDEPTDEPTNPTDEPTNPTDEPTNPTDEPTNPTDEPTNPTDEPTDPTGEPTTDNDTPGDDADNNTQDDDVIVIPDGDNTEPADADEIPDEEIETGSCTYIPNSFVSNWTDNFPTGWVGKRDLTGANTAGGKKNFIDYEKIDRGEGNYALRAYIDDPADNLYAFELPPFVPNKNNAALPTKLTFDLKASSTSKISINLRCGDTGTTEDKKYLAYNWKQESKSFVYSGNNAYDFVNLEDNEYHEVAVVFGDKLTEEFWRGKICRIEFKYGKKKPEDTSADFDIVVDNFVFHTKAGACEQDDIIDEENDDDVLPDADEIVTDADEIVTDADEVEDADEIVTDADEVEDADEITDGDSEPEIECIQIQNGDFSGTWTAAGVPEKWEKQGSSVTLSNVDGALKIQSSNTGTNQKVVQTLKFTTAADAEIPAGIKFRMAAPKASPVSLNLYWGSGSNDYYAYNLEASSNAYIFSGTTNPRFHDFDKRVDFGDTSDPKMHDVMIIFGSEIADKWQGNENLQLAFRAGKKNTYGETEIIVDDFELVYYGEACSNVATTYTVGYAGLQSPASVEGYVGMEDTFYGKLWVEGLTNVTYNQTIYLMGVRGQFGVKPQGADDTEYTWYDAAPNLKNTTLGNDDEYMYSHTFSETGNFDYTFRFTTDNGYNWPMASTEPGSATIFAPEANQIPNSNFEYWNANVSAPQLWIAGTGTFERNGTDGDYELKVSRASGSNDTAFKSKEFNVSSDAKLPTKITFNLATDGEVRISIGLHCGSQEWKYIWDVDNKDHFKSNGSHQYKAVDFEDEAFHPTWIDTSDITDPALWNGKTCYLEIRYGSNSTAVSAKFDDFQIVYPVD